MSRQKQPNHPESSNVGAHTAPTFTHEDEYWTVTYERLVLRLADAKGVRYVAHLVQRPNEPFSALDMISVCGEGGCVQPTAGAAERARSAVTKRIKATLLRLRVHHPSLARHLARTIQTGHSCVYRPLLDNSR